MWAIMLIVDLEEARSSSEWFHVVAKGFRQAFEKELTCIVCS